jgi:hypothetical protein
MHVPLFHFATFTTTPHLFRVCVYMSINPCISIVHGVLHISIALIKNEALLSLNNNRLCLLYILQRQSIYYNNNKMHIQSI